MEYPEILQYFEQQWEKVRELTISTGLNRAFYPVVFPDKEGTRLIDTAASALRSDITSLRTCISNPIITHFEGLVLEERVDGRMFDENTGVVTVTYVRKGNIYEMQCVKSIDAAHDNLTRYIAISIPKQTEPIKELEIVYEEIEPLLREEE